MGEPVRVLIVDDSAGDARIVELSLSTGEDPEFQCERVDRLDRGLERLGRGAVEAMVLDANLPDGRGCESLERIRRTHPDLPIVVHTGSEDPALRRAYLRAGADDFLVKGPPRPGRYARAIHGAIARQHLLRSLPGPAERDPRDLAALDQAGIGAAVLVEGRLRRSNDRFWALLGAGRSEPSALPEWLRGRVRVLPFEEFEERDASPEPIRIWGSRSAGDPSAGLLLIRSVADPEGLGEASRAPETRAPTPAHAPVLDEGDWSDLAELAGTDPAFLRNLIDQFTTEAASLVEELASAAEERDLDRIERAAHRLKSGAAQFGARVAAERCRAIEEAARRGDGVSATGEVPAALDALAASFRALAARRPAAVAARS